MGFQFYKKNEKELWNPKCPGYFSGNCFLVMIQVQQDKFYKLMFERILTSKFWIVDNFS